ncbi:aspartyl-tRNA synthetase [Metamycoplasma subdolum]|uniref:Aspartate--tRNA ligase n=1 Tax=Metamycoplasma subdolum TaxID=92407 RepID=A0A3M0A1I8_9BACT|nr:aspartate--tRNA ligase [Metamycoplasma subdolum]RMA78650.1 aspartyl-tRNA synthetase [Metamycoplasma subdolum]WPB50748.1 aspartate--tRNA ligase [Metamycoplasma subdolum]
MKKTYNTSLSVKDINKTVELYGWISNKRKFKDQYFIDLRDSSGIIQLVMHGISDPSLTKESCLKVKGIVKRRIEENEQLKTGKIEVHVLQYEILNISNQIPFEISRENTANEDLRLEYRFLDLRQEKMLDNLKLRHKLFLLIRNYFNKAGFIEVETPILSKSTPEGARDYLVPTRRKGKFFALPQSPQLYKQLLMAAGVERYFQIARVFRDEDLRKDRQPEFTQLDIEMSFGGQKELFKLCEKLWKTVLEPLGWKIKTPFPEMDFETAMLRYGNDKPDTRFGFLINDFSKELCQMLVKDYVKVMFFDRDVAEHMQIINETFRKNNGETLLIKTKEELKEFGPEIEEKLLQKAYEEDNLEDPICVFSLANKEENALKSLGAIRTLLNEIFEIADPNQLNFLWIVNWPMFEFDENENKYVSAHHPFTQFERNTLKYLKTGEFEKVRAKSYDLVLNGFELGSGSIRIHDAETQKLMFDVLGISEKEQHDKFSFFLKAFDYGLPPHNGIAFGLERLLMILTNSSSIRDVIAFPKNAKGIDLLSASPSNVSEEQLKEYSIKLIEER